MNIFLLAGAYAANSHRVLGRAKFIGPGSVQLTAAMHDADHTWKPLLYSTEREFM